MDAKLVSMVSDQIKLQNLRKRIISRQPQVSLCVGELPGQRRWDVKVHVEIVGTVEVRADVIVGGDLRKRSRAAGPAVPRVSFVSLIAIIGVIEGLGAKPLEPDEIG